MEFTRDPQDTEFVYVGGMRVTKRIAKILTGCVLEEFISFYKLLDPEEQELFRYLLDAGEIQKYVKENT